MGTLELEARIDNLLVTAREETANIDLFAPNVEREECPICMIPLPFNEDHDRGSESRYSSRYMPCCGKRICTGCIMKSAQTEKQKGVKHHELKCAFCRQLTEKACNNEMEFEKVNEE